MGLWSAITSVCSSVADTVKSVCHSIKEKVTGVWNSFTGKDKFDEANKIYEEISKKYNDRYKQFKDDLNMYNDLIEHYVAVINDAKGKIKTELFVDMSKKMEQIKDVEVSRDFLVEAYNSKTLITDSIRTKEELYKIDFDKDKFKTTVQAVFTLGFYTRKKAKETLFSVKEEKRKLEAEMTKMDAEIKRLQLIEASLKNVAYYFTSLIELYGNLLVRLDGSVNYLTLRCMTFAHKLVDAEMSIRRLPKAQQKEIEAIITASKILKAMTEEQILSIENEEKVVTYSKTMGKQHDNIREVYCAA